jgi:iron complex outermembrane receptor protein
MTFKTRLLSAGIMAAVATAVFPAASWAQAPAAAGRAMVTLDIPAGPAPKVLNAFAAQAQLQLVYPYADVAGRTAPALRGQFERGEAIRRVAASVGLEVVSVDEGTVTLRSPQGGSADIGAQPTAVDEIIVTAQKKEERIQDVPIAISAFSSQALDEQKIEGGFDLLKAIPNVTFSKNNFTGYNFSIRGIGTKAVSATTDPAVAISFNNTTLLRNRLFEQEYFDVERVEVLRGPQGTLYGRNATSGVVNVITAKPDLNDFEGSLKGEVGNYNAKRLSGMLNVPLIDDVLGVRFAGAMTQRDGYGYNQATRNDVDGRDLWSTRLTVAFEPTDRFRANAVWERFNEDDNRARTSKQLCHRDPGPEAVGGIDITVDNPGYRMLRGYLSQSCLPGSLYDDDAYGTPNGTAMPFTTAGVATSLGILPGGAGVGLLTQGQDPYQGSMQSRDLRTIDTLLDPTYQAHADVYQLNVEFDLTPSLTLFSQTAYVEDRVFSTQDYNRFRSVVAFNSSSGGLIDGNGNPTFNADLSPGGYFTDPQMGTSNTLLSMDLSKGESTQFSQEFRLQSAFDGPLNFSAGANYLKFEVVDDYYVFANTMTAYSLGSRLSNRTNAPNDPALQRAFERYVDPNPVESLDGLGHNYFRSQNPYELESVAVFGELYWQATDTLKVTGGLRYTDDRKQFERWPSQALEQNAFMYDPADPFQTNGFLTAHPECAVPADQPLPHQCLYYSDGVAKQRWREVTGRAGVDWTPTLSFTDQTMVYAFYSHGYKGGGANPPAMGGQIGSIIDDFTGANAQTFNPEFVDAFEVGVKNTLLNGSLTLNLGAFYYDYKDYQVSQIVDRIALNENFDTSSWGLELETVWRPIRDFRINANVGFLRTRIGDGESSIDPMNRTQGNPDWMVVKPWAQFPSNCIAPRAVVEHIIDVNAGFGGFLDPTTGIASFGSPVGLCAAGFPANSFQAFLYGAYDRSALAAEANNGRGFAADLSGNELPNAPHLTFNIGAQYTLHPWDGWDATLRGDFYYQSQSFARVYNTQYDKLRAWKNANISLTFTRPEDDLTIEIYAKNVFDDQPITDAFLNSDDTGLTTNVFTLDPRLIGLSVRKGF